MLLTLFDVMWWLRYPITIIIQGNIIVDWVSDTYVIVKRYHI